MSRKKRLGVARTLHDLTGISIEDADDLILTGRALGWGSGNVGQWVMKIYEQQTGIDPVTLYWTAMRTIKGRGKRGQ